MAGGRSIAAADLFVGALETSLGPDEIITGGEPRWPAGRRWAFEEFSRARRFRACRHRSLLRRERRRAVLGMPVRRDRCNRQAAPASAAAEAALRRTRDRRGQHARSGARHGRRREPANNITAAPEFRRALTCRACLRAAFLAQGRGTRHSFVRSGAKLMNSRSTERGPAPRSPIICAISSVSPARMSPAEHRYLRRLLRLIVDGAAVRTCLMLSPSRPQGARTGDGRRLFARRRTDAVAGRIQRRHGLRCGYCTPGVLTTLHAPLVQHRTPTKRDTRSLSAISVAAPAIFRSSRRRWWHRAAYRKESEGEARCGGQRLYRQRDRTRRGRPAIRAAKANISTDIKRNGMWHAAFLRSPLGRSPITGCDSAAALAIPVLRS